MIEHLVHIWWCPAQVGTVYSATNIWVNIQEGGRPWDISWQLADPAAWRPFFGELLPHKELASLQVRV
jgi:hypothetical protein